MKAKIQEIVESIKIQGKRLNQHLPEFIAFLEYALVYFSINRIKNPIVVEIGILDGAQRQFYEEIFGAEWIGIDINPKAPATIHGDSSHATTVQALKNALNGRMIDLLFIDGLHTYEGAKLDFDIYYPMTKHIVALHDILTYKLHPKDPVDVVKLWKEIVETNQRDTIISIQHFNHRKPEEFNGRPLGIGVLVKRG